MPTKLDCVTEAKIEVRIEKYLDFNKKMRLRAEEARISGNDGEYKRISRMADKACDKLSGMVEVLQALGYNFQEVKPGRVELYKIENWTVMV